MSEGRKVHGLAAAAGHLCAASEELSVAGYKRWSKEIRELIEIISAELSWLERDAPAPLVPPHR